jgi:[ribosomal protein S5]-alanine N-acetyltransferase
MSSGPESQSPELRLLTGRLCLRDFVEEDLADVHELRSHPEVAFFMDFAPESLEESRLWLDGVVFHNRVQPRKAYNLAIVELSENRVIGWIGMGDSEQYPTEGELGFGYMVNRTYWGKGYATEAVRRILDFGFSVLHGRRISAWCNEENRASARVLEKAGLRFERRYVDSEPKSGQTVACLEFSVSASDSPGLAEI